MRKIPGLPPAPVEATWAACPPRASTHLRILTGSMVALAALIGISSLRVSPARSARSIPGPAEEPLKTRSASKAIGHLTFPLPARQQQAGAEVEDGVGQAFGEGHLGREPQRLPSQGD